jgi:lipid-A-disaccharide synthase
MKDIPKVDTFRERHQLGNKELIALLPGSRKQEIKKMLPIMLEAVSKHDNWEPIIAGVSVHDLKFYQEIAGDKSIKVIYGETYQLLLNSKAAAVTSGTATLEAALLGCPHVILYRFSLLTYLLAKLVIGRRILGLPNVVLGRSFFPELLQRDVTPENIVRAVFAMADNRKDCLQAVQDLRQAMGGSGASERAAEELAKLMA